MFTSFDIVMVISELAKPSVSGILVIISEVDSVEGLVDSLILVDASVLVVVAEEEVVSGLVMSKKRGIVLPQ